ncbi:MAG: hypothetical protein EOP10_02550 [Proteobacteria bacterium]|nr:MAG: hypothetical protein EOP10_02550 [Pseudomonadota bacterium]
MNFEQHDNFLLADWTCRHSPLSSEGQKEVQKLEEFYRFACDQAAKDRVQAVLWIQKVPCYDASDEWLKELSDDLLRDQLRSRILRLHKLQRAIRSSPIPWIYATEKDCLGTMFELMQACHKKFVFERETWFGFPEFAIGQVSSLGWLSAQLQRQPSLARTWTSRSVISAEEAVQLGVMTAALTWKDWRRHLISWMQQQIQTIEADGFVRKEPSPHVSWGEGLWRSREFSFVAKSHIESYRQISTQAIPYKMVDRELIDTASHFMMQPLYERWLKAEVQRLKSWGRQSIPKLIYFDITESIPPMATFCRLLDRGVRVVVFANSSTAVQAGVEKIFNHLNKRYSRSEIQLLTSRIAWFVGPAPEAPECYTMKFGQYREFYASFRDVKIKGWALSAQKMKRQTVEVQADDPDLSSVIRSITDVFDGAYLVRGKVSPYPLLFRVRSLALQLLVYYCQDTRTSWSDMVEQLVGVGWALLGNEKFWEKFFAYRSTLNLEESAAPLGRYGFDMNILRFKKMSDALKSSNKKIGEASASGPGVLHRTLTSFAYQLSTDLVSEGYFASREVADLYISDALGFPSASGTPAIFVKRLGEIRAAEARAAMDIRSV